MKAGARADSRWHPAGCPAALLLAVAAGLSGCGQTGALYLPEDGSATVITRPGPASTANPAPAPPTSGAAGAPSVPVDEPDDPPARRR